MRTHIALPVSDLAASVRFYELLLGTKPARVLPRYAQFLLDEPGLNLALTEVDGEKVTGTAGGRHHFGIEVETTEAVRSALQRVRGGGIEVTVEQDAVCCYSRQDKFWAVDPDGHRWEVFFVSRRYQGLDEEDGSRAGGAARGTGGQPGEAGNTAACCEPAAEDWECCAG